VQHFLADFAFNMSNCFFDSGNFGLEALNRVGYFAEAAIEIVFLRFSLRIAEQLDVLVEAVDRRLSTHGGIQSQSIASRKASWTAELDLPCGVQERQSAPRERKAPLEPRSFTELRVDSRNIFYQR
jgi:hypothetical protein